MPRMCQEGQDNQRCHLKCRDHRSRRGDTEDQSKARVEERNEDHIRREGGRETGNASSGYNLHNR